MLELRQPLPLIVIHDEKWKGPVGKATAFFLHGEHQEVNLVWTVVMHDTGQCWSIPNQFIRFPKNITELRNAIV